MKLSLDRNIALRKPIFLVYLTLFVLLSVLASIVFTRSGEIIKKYSHTLETVSGKLELLLKIRKNSELIKSAVVGFVVHSDSAVSGQEAKSVTSLLGNNRKSWSVYKTLVESKEEEVIFDSLMIYEQQQSDTWAKIIKIKQSKTGNNISDTALHVLILNPAYTRYQNTISVLSDFVVTSIHTDGKKIENLVFNSRKKFLLFIFFSFFLLLILGVLILKAISKLQNDNSLLKEQDKQINEQKILVEGILSSAPDGIIGVDGTGQIVLFNKQAEAMFGYSNEEIMGASPEKIISFNIGGTPASSITEYFAGFSGSTMRHLENDLYAFNKNGNSYPVDINLGSIQTDKGIYFILVARDVSKRKIAEEELKEKNSVLKSLSSYLQNVREEERKYLAREVHDELGQLVSALKIDIDWFGIRGEESDGAYKNRSIHANKTIDILLTSIRKIASGLRPSVLDDFGLNAALRWQCKEFQNLNNIPCIFEEGFDDTAIPINIKTELFRMAQEAMTNVMRHAKASYIRISTEEDEKHLSLTITDNGVGFDMGQHKNTLGLIGLRERALSIDGKLKIESSIGNGTIISIVLPKKL